MIIRTPISIPILAVIQMNLQEMMTHYQIKIKDILGDSLSIDAYLQCSLSDDESEELDEDDFGLYDEIKIQQK